jgi:hypothetical protein
MKSARGFWLRYAAWRISIVVTELKGDRRRRRRRRVDGVECVAAQCGG